MRNPREWLRRLMAVTVQLAAFAPAFLLGAFFAAPTRMGMLFAIPVGAGILCIWLSFCRAALRRVGYPLLALAAGICALALGITPRLLLYALLNVAWVIYLSVTGARGVAAGALVGMALHLICGIAANAPVLAPISGCFFAIACAYLVLLAFYVNAASLRDQCAARAQRPASGMRIGNALMCAVYLAAVFFIAQFERIKQTFISAMQAIGRLIGRLLALFTPESAPESLGGAKMDFGALGGEAAEPSLFVQILEKIAYLLAILAAVAALYFLMRRLSVLLRKLYRRVSALLRQYFSALSVDYTDEDEAISSWGELSHTLTLRARKMLQRARPRAWRDMDNRERVRSVYARVRATRADLPASCTAREALEQLPLKHADVAQFAQSYDRARYSEHPITDSEAENARRAL